MKNKNKPLQKLRVVHDIVCAPTPNPHDFWREQVRLERNGKVEETYEATRNATKVICYKQYGDPARTIRVIEKAQAGILTPERDEILAKFKEDGWELEETLNEGTGDPREQEYGRQTIYVLSKEAD